ncbi:hypothetical protein II906_11510 [bacterium]|nr:hypothetical protein [bacterium]
MSDFTLEKLQAYTTSVYDDNKPETKKKENTAVTVPVGQTANTEKKEEKPITGLEVEKQDKKYDTKEERKAAEKEIAKQFVEFGDSTGKKYTEKEAAKEAEKYVKNEHYKEEFETFNKETTVYVDKKAYKAAKKEIEAKEDELYKQYRAQGMSRKEAREKAKTQSPNIELAGRSARNGFTKLGLVEADGTIGKKAQDYMVKQANIGNTQEGEVTSYHYELKERRATKANERAQGNKVTLHQLGKMADAVHLHKEKNNTALYRAGAAAAIIGATTAAAYAIAPITVSSSSAAAAGATSVVEGAGSAIAGATGAGAASATIGPAALATGLAPLGALGLLFSDKGKKVQHIAKPGEAPKPEPEVQPEPEKQPEPEVQPQPCPEDKWESEFCDHKVKAGDDWSRVAQGKVRINGKKLDGKLLRAYVHAEKLQHGVTDFTKNTFMKQGENYRLYTDFSNLLENEAIIKKHPELLLLKDAQITIDCDGKYTAGKLNKDPKIKFFKYTGNPLETNKYKQDCHDNSPVRINNK